MQESRISFFRQKNRMLPTVLSIIVCLSLSPVLGSVLLFPQVLTLVPVALLLLLSYVGPVSAVACIAILISFAFSLFGGAAAACMALLIVPAVAVSVFVCEKDQPFWTAGAASSVTMFASMGAVLGLISILAGSDVVTALTQAMRQVLSEYAFMGDMLLTMLIQMGGVAAPEGFDAALGVASIDPATREELLSAVLMMTDTVLRLEIPMQMATGAIAAGVFGQAVLRKGAIKRGASVSYPPLNTWRVPKGWGRILGGTLAALYVLSRLMPSSMSSMFYVFSGVFDQVFAMQGIAAVCYMLHDRRKHPRWQKLVFVLGYTMLRSGAVMIGIFDQMMDFTHRREALDKDENPFDPRKNHLI